MKTGKCNVQSPLYINLFCRETTLVKEKASNPCRNCWMWELHIYGISEGPDRLRVRSQLCPEPVLCGLCWASIVTKACAVRCICVRAGCAGSAQGNSADPAAPRRLAGKPAPHWLSSASAGALESSGTRNGAGVAPWVGQPGEGSGIQIWLFGQILTPIPGSHDTDPATQTCPAISLTPIWAAP